MVILETLAGVELKSWAMWAAAYISYLPVLHDNHISAEKESTTLEVNTNTLSIYWALTALQKQWSSQAW